ncbi:hypothetical protein Elgi_60290 [Paenibacillus elgii]|nr:hypothetical protein Elgi_60290 [Paenibacillus elgii]
MGTPTSSSVTLMWGASTDNIGVTGYQVYRGTTLVTTVSGSKLDYTVMGLSPETTYTFTVRAVDAAGNVSPGSNSVSAKTASSPSVSPWAPNTAYTVGTLVTYDGKTYECLLAHTSLPGWQPPNTSVLWLLK